MNEFARFRSAAVAAICLLAAGVANAETRSKHYDLTSGQTLKLSLGSGAKVSVQGWEQAGMEVTLSDSSRSLDDYAIQVSKAGDGLELRSARPPGNGNSQLRIDLKVPRSLRFDLDSPGGSVNLSELVGEFTGRTGGGSLVLKQLTGRVDLRTGGGQIEASDSTLDGQVRTGGGRVLVSNVIGDLRASSGGGDVVYRNDPAGGRTQVDQAPAGVRVETGGGNVRVAGAEHFVAARTGGGDIEVELGGGWVEASTGAGDIEVTVLRDIVGEGDIDLESGLGEVLLTLPADFSMSVDIDLGLTKNAGGNPTITSDFPLKITRSDEWDYSMGTPRKHICGRGSLGGGLHKLKIRTTNGDVTIRRAGNRK